VLTVCRGEVVMRDGEIVGPEGHGRFIRRGAGVAVESHVA
jgi:N-acyl-D-aspartate/D-glutamate deacylase